MSEEAPNYLPDSDYWEKLATATAHLLHEFGLIEEGQLLMAVEAGDDLVKISFGHGPKIVKMTVPMELLQSILDKTVTDSVDRLIADVRREGR